VIPSIVDPTMAPQGKHMMSIFVQYAAYDMSEYGNRDQQREAFGNAVIDTRRIWRCGSNPTLHNAAPTATNCRVQGAALDRSRPTNRQQSQRLPERSCRFE
jgi:hypothetical protein